VASRAEARTGRGPADRVAPLPRLGAAIRAAFTDYYFNSMRLVPANVVWGAGLVIVVVVGLAWPLGGLLLLPLLALPTAGIFRLAARIVRVAPDAGLRDVLWPYRRAAAPTLALGVAVTASTLILGTNLVVGIGQGTVTAWVLATLAGWGLVAVWAGAIVAWPIVVDPARETLPLRARLRIAGTLLLAAPGRVAVLTVAIAITTAVSTVLTAALLTVSVSFVALVACRIVLPAADRIAPVLDGDRP
jgi:hypothetical protein